MTIEEKIKEVKHLNHNTPDGGIIDADTILADIVEKSDMQETGLADELLMVYEKETDAKHAVKDVFLMLTGISFEDYLDACIEKITRK